MTKIRGGQQLIDQLLADLDDIDDTTDLDLRLVKLDPQVAHERLVEIRSLTHRMRRRISEDLDAALQRVEGRAAQAALPERVAALEREVADLKAQQWRGQRGTADQPILARDDLDGGVEPRPTRHHAPAHRRRGAGRGER